MKNDNAQLENINNNSPLSNTTKKKDGKIIIGFIFILIILLGIIVFVLKNNKKQIETINKNKYSKYQLKDSYLSDFDLYFLQLENNNKNMVYSPLSIKFTLEMLSEGANGETKKQIDNILGTYLSKKHLSSNNMFFANALFINNKYKNNINSSYINTLKDKYDADVYYDEFTSPNNINNWISNKTYKLIDTLYDDVSNEDFILVNVLGIDMEWIKKIQSEYDDYYVTFSHEDFVKYISSLSSNDYSGIDFANYNDKAKSVELGVVANRYDIINELGENNIREKVTEEYNKWLKNNSYEMCGSPDNLSEYDKLNIDEYIKELSSNYKYLSSSTDFQYYVDDETKVFAKDLKNYNGTTLQYVGIMPTKDDLNSYIKNITKDKINNLINNLKSIELNSFKDGVITTISGKIPMFKFDYELSLIKDLNTLGITDAFSSKNADFSNLSTSKAYINDAKHKTKIEFSNDGIKAAAITDAGGSGAGECGFDYKFDVPVENIDLTFDKPYIFIIRDKNSGEVWFVGSVYEPIKFEANPNLG